MDVIFCFVVAWGKNECGPRIPCWLGVGFRGLSDGPDQGRYAGGGTSFWDARVCTGLGNWEWDRGKGTWR